MSYANILAGLHERLSAVPGIATVLVGPPGSVQVTPLLFSMPHSGEVQRSGQVKTQEYRTDHYLLFGWQEAMQAVQQMVPLIDAVYAAIGGDPHLGGRLPNGFADIAEHEVLWLEVANVTYLAVRFQSLAIER